MAAKPTGSRGGGAKTTPAITAARNGFITARLSVSNKPPAPVAPCPLALAAKAVGYVGTGVSLFSPFFQMKRGITSIRPLTRLPYAAAQAQKHGASPLGAAGRALLRDLRGRSPHVVGKLPYVGRAAADFGKGVALDAAFGAAEGALKSAANNYAAHKAGTISSANYAGRIGHGLVQGGASAAGQSVAWGAAGAIIGGIAGAAFGGVGAVPGAVIGAKVGMAVGPLIDNLTGGHVKSAVDKQLNKVIPSEAAFGRAADKAAGAVSKGAAAVNKAAGAVGGAVSGALTGVSKSLGGAARFLGWR